MDDGQRDLDRALSTLQAEVPDPLCRALRWLRDPKARRVRLAVGVLFMLGGTLWFLPIFGVEWLLIGLLLVAQDVPFLKKPVGHCTLWLEECWQRFRRRYWPRHGGKRSCK